MNNDSLHECMRHVLADFYALYVKVQNFHWNVEGPHFVTLHALFEERYIELNKSIDELAELIRSSGFRVPGTLSFYMKNTCIRVNHESPSACEMLHDLIADHETVTHKLGQMAEVSGAMNDHVVGDFAVRQMAECRKFRWILKSLLSENAPKGSQDE